MSDPNADLVHLPALTPMRRSPAELAEESEEIREMMRAVLVDGTDYGQIPGTQKPTLFKSGAEWLLKWARFGHHMEVVEVDRDNDGRKYGVTYRCTVSALGASDVVVATCDGYAGYDEPDREEHTSKWGKKIPRAPWNTIIKMAQKRALVGATLQATSTSGLFTQDMDDTPAAPALPPPPKTQGWADAAQEAEAHKALAERIAALPEDHPARVTARDMRQRIGWPMSADRLGELGAVLLDAERGTTPDVPGPEAEAAADSQPPPPEAAPGAPDGQSGDSCVGCGKVVDPKASESGTWRATVTSDGQSWHAKCVPFEDDPAPETIGDLVK